MVGAAPSVAVPAWVSRQSPHLALALGWLWGGLGVALGGLCSQESMPSICPVYGLAVASGGLSVQGSRFRVQGSGFRVQGSRFDVLPITFVHSSPARRA